MLDPHREQFDPLIKQRVPNFETLLPYTDYRPLNASPKLNVLIRGVIAVTERLQINSLRTPELIMLPSPYIFREDEFNIPELKDIEESSLSSRAKHVIINNSGHVVKILRPKIDYISLQELVENCQLTGVKVLVSEEGIFFLNSKDVLDQEIALKLLHNSYMNGQSSQLIKDLNTPSEIKYLKQLDQSRFNGAEFSNLQEAFKVFVKYLNLQNDEPININALFDSIYRELINQENTHTRFEFCDKRDRECVYLWNLSFQVEEGRVFLFLNANFGGASSCAGHTDELAPDIAKLFNLKLATDIMQRTFLIERPPSDIFVLDFSVWKKFGINTDNLVKILNSEVLDDELVCNIDRYQRIMFNFEGETYCLSVCLFNPEDLKNPKNLGHTLLHTHEEETLEGTEDCIIERDSNSHLIVKLNQKSNLLCIIQLRPGNKLAWTNPEQLNKASELCKQLCNELTKIALD